jgi:hypothetical protein
MTHNTIRSVIRSTVVLFTAVFSILGPLSSSIVADTCGAEPLRLTLTNATLQDIQFKRAIFEEAMRVARALRWDVPTNEQKVPAFTKLDQADALVSSMSDPLNHLGRSRDIQALVMLVLMESSRNAHADLRAAVEKIQADTAQKIALKQKLDEAAGHLFELTASLVAGYRSAARGNVYQVDRQVTIPRRITLLDSKLASLTLEAPIGGAFRVNVTCNDESGAPLYVRAQLLNLFDIGGDTPIPLSRVDSLGVTIQTYIPAGRAAIFALDLQAADAIETGSLIPCLVVVTQDRLLSVPPEAITPQKKNLLTQLLALQTDQLTELRNQARLLLTDPQAQGSEDAIVDVLASQVSRVNQLSRLNALSDIRMTDVELKTEVDVLSELSELESLRMQAMMDRRSKFISTLSNLLQKISTTQNMLASSLK